MVGFNQQNVSGGDQTIGVDVVLHQVGVKLHPFLFHFDRFVQQDAVALEPFLDLRGDLIESGNVGHLRSGKRRRHEQQDDSGQGYPEGHSHAEGRKGQALPKDNTRLRYKSRAAGPNSARRLPMRKIDPAAHASGHVRQARSSAARGSARVSITVSGETCLAIAASSSAR